MLDDDNIGCRIRQFAICPKVKLNFFNQRPTFRINAALKCEN